MANVLGSLLVELGINVAAFVSGIDKATYKSAQFAKEIKSTFSEVGGSINNAMAAIGGFGSAVDSAFSRATSSMTGFLRSGSLIATTGELSMGAVLGLGGAALGAAAAAGALALNAMELAQHFENMSAATGLSVRDVQVWERAAKEAGISSEGLMMSLGRVQLQLGRYIETGGRAASTSGMFVRTMHELGITVEDSQGHVRPLNDMLLDFAEVLNSVTDQEERTALGLVAMGRGGREFVEWVNSVRVQGGDLRATMKEIGEQSGILTDQQAKDLAADRAEWERFVQKVEDVGIRTGAVFARMAEDAATNRKMFDERGQPIRRTPEPTAATKPGVDVAAILKQNEAMQHNIDVIALGSKARANLKEAEEKMSSAMSAGDMQAEMAAAKQVAAARVAVEAETETNRVTKVHTDEVQKHTEAMQAEIAAHARFAGALGNTTAAIERNHAIEAADTDAGRMRAELQQKMAEAEERLTDATSKHGKAATAAAADAKQEVDFISSELKELTASTAKWEEYAAQKQETATSDALYSRLVADTEKIRQQTAAIIEETNARTAQQVIEGRVNAAMAADRAKVAEGGSRPDDVAALATEQAARYAEVTKEVEKQFEAEQRTSKANLEGIQAETTAVLQNADARREAAVQAQVGSFKAAHPDFDPSQMAAVAATMERISEAQQKLNDGQRAASLDVRLGYEDEITELQRIDALYGESRDIHLAVSAAEIEAQRKMQHELDMTAEKVGTIGQGFRGFLNELILQGTQLQAGFFDVLNRGMSGFEDSLAKFIVTGRGGFLGVLREMEEALIRLGLQFLVAKAMQALFGAGASATQTAGVLTAQIGRQAAIGEAAAEAATAAAWAGPEAAIAAAALTEGALQGITALAAGGDMAPGHAYLVGEKHPEILMAGTAGHVYPSVGEAQRDTGAPSGGTSNNITVNHTVNSLDPSSLKKVLSENSDILASVIADHIRKLNYA